MLTTVLLGLLQTTWVVDAAAGPGSHFTDLPAAIAAAANGDTILVRAGSYSAFAIASKALAIRGAGAGITIVNGPSHSVTATPVGGVNLFAGLSIRGDLTASLQARVELLDCVVLGNGGTFTGSVALQVQQSELFALRCVVKGGEVFAPLSGIGPSGIGQTYAGIAVRVQGGFFSAYDCDITGGQNFANNPFMQHFGGSGLATFAASWARTDSCRIAGGNALHSGGLGVSVVGDGHLQIQGDATDIVQGGTTGFGGGISAIYVSSPSSVTVHGATPIVGTIVGPVTLGAPELPELSVAATTLPSGETDASQSVTVTFDGLVPSAPFALLIGFQLDYTPSLAPLVGDLLLNAASAAFLTGLLDAAGQLQFGFVPAGLFGGGVPFPFYMQAATFDPSGDVRLSNLDARFYSL